MPEMSKWRSLQIATLALHDALLETLTWEPLKWEPPKMPNNEGGYWGMGEGEPRPVSMKTALRRFGLHRLHSLTVFGPADRSDWTVRLVTDWRRRGVAYRFSTKQNFAHYTEAFEAEILRKRMMDELPAGIPKDPAKPERRRGGAI